MPRVLTTTPTLFNLKPRFDGRSYDPILDGERLSTQLQKVFELMRDGHWRTLAEIQAAAGGSESGVAARLRDLRKPRFGGYSVQRRRCGSGGLFEYRLVSAAMGTEEREPA